MVGTREIDQRAGARAGCQSASRVRSAGEPSTGEPLTGEPLTGPGPGSARGERRARVMVRPGRRLRPYPDRRGPRSGRKRRPELVRSCVDVRGAGWAATGSGRRSPGPIRLTRRGRRVRAALVGFVAAALAGALVLVASTVASSALASGGKALASGGQAPVRVVLVRPGETVWELAERVDGDRDPRAVVDRIAELNDLARVGSIQAGDRLRIPVAGS